MASSLSLLRGVRIRRIGAVRAVQEREKRWATSAGGAGPSEGSMSEGSVGGVSVDEEEM